MSKETILVAGIVSALVSLATIGAVRLLSGNKADKEPEPTPDGELSADAIEVIVRNYLDVAADNIISELRITDLNRVPVQFLVDTVLARTFREAAFLSDETDESHIHLLKSVVELHHQPGATIMIRVKLIDEKTGHAVDIGVERPAVEVSHFEEEVK